ncbi:MAG: pimeloyl-ACP methyl ester carboxylesterase [Nitriliruptoraceae bacterium]|jgi:pimeloyl-ACP methyl ester carboxylesterase
MTPDAHPAATPTVPRRTAAHAWAETRGLIGRHTAPARDVDLTTSDGVRLRATLLPGPVDHQGAGPAVVLLHGFAAHRRKPRYAWLADELATRLTVLAPDLRGHGQSSGISGLGADEHADVAACVQHLRDLGHPWVAVIGVSMGATSTGAALHAGVAVDAAVIISGPGWIDMEPTSPPMARLNRIWKRRGGRLGLRAVVGVRIPDRNGWVAPVAPGEAARSLPRATLVVHGADDAWFGLDHAQAVLDGHGAATAWHEPVFGHAEDGFLDPFGRRLALALLTAYTSGTFPDRQDSLWPS